MSENDNELKQALAENGNFDDEKAKQMAEKTISRFHRRMKWMERSGLIYFTICFAVFVFALVQFTTACTTKAMIGFTIVLLISYGLGILVAVIAGVQSMLLRVLKEIKQSQLEYLGFTTDHNVSPSKDSLRFDVRPRVLTWREIVSWKLIIIIIALTVIFTTHRLLPDRVWLSDMAHFEGAPVTLDAPPIGAPVRVHVYLRMDQGVCKVSRVTPEHEQSEMFWMGEGSWHSQLPPGNSLRLDPQGNTGEYWVRFE